MNGVEILSSAEVVAETRFNWTAFGIALGMIACVALLISIVPVIKNECHWRVIPICLLVGVLGGSMIGALFGEFFGTPLSYETHYKVTIDDSVSMNEFIEKYEIIEQDGKIYTVRER